MVCINNQVSLSDWKDRVLDFLSNCKIDYPGFNIWLEKVFSGVGIDRIILLYTDGDIISGISILKNSPTEKKICTLYVDSFYRRRGIGTVLIQESYKILGTRTPGMTVSEKQLPEYKSFLLKSGANQTGSELSLYYPWEREYFFNYRDVLISIKPKYVKEIIAGNKRVEFRKRGFSSSVFRAYIYESSPTKKIVGFFNIDQIVYLGTEELWERFSDISGITKKELSEYLCGRSGYAICFSEFHQFKTPVDPSTVIDNFTAPQSFCYIDGEIIKEVG